MKIRTAVRHNSFIKLAYTGLAGAGKTATALETATYLSQKGIALIEADYPFAASKYAKQPGEQGFGWTFDAIELALDDNDRDIEKPYNPRRFIEAIKTIYATGRYDVLVIDGFSNEWNGAGGMLEWVDDLQKYYQRQNQDRKDYTRQAWGVATPEHRKLLQYILRVKMHVIVTMQANKETVTTKDQSGTRVEKMVLDPVQRDTVPYLFDVLAVLHEKQIRIDTSHCPLLEEGQIVERSGPFLANTLQDWLRDVPVSNEADYDPDALVEPEKSEAEVLRERIKKAQGRAAKCVGVTDKAGWEKYLVAVLGQAKTLSQLTTADVTRIEEDLTKCEAAAVAQAEQAAPVPAPSVPAATLAFPAQPAGPVEAPTVALSAQDSQADKPASAPAQSSNLTVVVPDLKQIIALADKRAGGYGALHTLLVKQYHLPEDALTWTEKQRLQAYAVLNQNTATQVVQRSAELAATGEPATEAQLASIRRMYERLGKEPPGMPATYLAAKELIAQLSQEYKQSRTSTVRPDTAQTTPDAPAPQASQSAKQAQEPLDNAPVPKGWLVQITELATAQKKKITRPANYGEAKKLLAELQAAS